MAESKGLNRYLALFLFVCGIVIYSEIARNWGERLALSVLGVVVCQFILDFQGSVFLG